MSSGSIASGLLRRHARALIPSLALGLGLAWVLKAGALPLLAPEGSLGRTNWFLAAVSAVALLLSMLLRFARYYFLINSIARTSMGRIMTVSAVAVGLITFLPFRLGEVARPAMLREKDRLSGWAVTGTVGAERIMDGVVFGLILLLGLLYAEPQDPLPERIGNLPVPAALVPRAALLATVGFGAAFVVMAVFFWWRATARRVTERVLGLISARVAKAVADAVERISEGLKFLPRMQATGPFIALTLLSLLTHIWALQALALAVGLPELSLAQATVVLGVLGLGFAMPNAPGFFGSIQLALYSGLAVYVEPHRVVNEGAAFVFLFYVTYLALVILVSLAGVVAEYTSPVRSSA